MSSRRSRSAQPLRPDSGSSAMGTWGLVLTLIVLLMFVAGMSAAALYLETGQARSEVTGESDELWPPEGIEAPPRSLAGVGLALIVLSSLALTVGLRRMVAGGPRAAGLSAAAGSGSAVAAALALSADLASVPFGWDEHAYTSIYWILTCTTILFVAVGALMAASVVVQILVGVVDRERHLELVNTVAYSWFTAITAAILLALVHVLPLVTGSS